MTDHTDDPDGVLAPDDLAVDDEAVTRLSEDRYVIDADGDPDPGSDGAPPAPTGSGDASLAAVPEAYAIDLTVKTERGVASFEHRSDDVREQFEALLRWYASRLSADRSADEVLGVLLEETDLG